MTIGAFLVVLAVGAAMVAVWLETRFERLGPADFRRSLIHVGIALSVGWLVVPPLMSAAVSAAVDPVVVVFTIGFPSLVYLFLAALWVLKHAQALLLRR